MAPTVRALPQKNQQDQAKRLVDSQSKTSSVNEEDFLIEKTLDCIKGKDARGRPYLTQALSHISEAQMLSPLDGRSLSLKSYILVKMARYEEALATLERGIFTAPNEKWFRVTKNKVLAVLVPNARESAIKTLQNLKMPATKKEQYEKQEAKETMSGKGSAALEAPPHPGPIIKEALFDKLDLSITETAEYLGVRREFLSRVLGGYVPLTKNVAKGLAPLFQKHSEEVETVYTAADLMVLQQRRNSFLKEQKLLHALG